MNEENNQNIPILGSNEGGGGLAPISGFPSGTYKIKFSDEYYQGVNSTNELIKGRIMLLQNDNVNDGNYFVETSRIYDDALVDKVVSHVSHSDAKYYRPTLEIGFFEEHSGLVPGNFILDYRLLIGGFPPTNEYHFVLDEEWYNKYYGEDSNKVLRTLATGQSDITRHEAHTKAQGLNWSNANVPKYSAEVTYEYVDLGLPSGTLWAKMNVGATSETDPGLYFAWGETEGYTAEQVGVDKQFTWADYKFNPSGDGATFTKYNTTDNKAVLDAEDDAAAVNMGGEWHMPNRAQCLELLKETKNGLVTNEGVFIQYTWNEADLVLYPTETTTTIDDWNIVGYLFFKNTYASVTEAISANDYLFIPAAGSCSNGFIVDVFGEGHLGAVYTSANDNDSLYISTWSFYFGSEIVMVDNSYSVRCVGQSVRGVIGNIDK